MVVVEGKTDTAVLRSLYDVDTIETSGLSLDDKTLAMIRTASQTRGVIILTDPDYPGQKIRHRIEQAVPHARHAFIKKEDAIGDKKLGVAEARKEAIVDALNNAVTFEKPQATLSWESFIALDIIGDTKRREQVYDLFNLGHGNVKTLFKRLNMAGITYEQIKEALDETII